MENNVMQNICESVGYDKQNREWDKTFPKSQKVSHRKVRFSIRRTKKSRQSTFP